MLIKKMGLVLLLTGLIQTAKAASPPEDFPQEMWDATWKLRYHMVFEPVGSDFVCKGVIVGKDLVLTAEHCADYFLREGLSYLENPSIRSMDQRSKSIKVTKIIRFSTFKSNHIVAPSCRNAAEQKFPEDVILRRRGDYRGGRDRGEYAAEFYKCVLARFHPFDLALVQTVKPIFKTDQILKVSMDYSPALSVQAPMGSWMKKETENGFEKFGKGARLSRAMSLHFSASEYGSSYFLRCTDKRTDITRCNPIIGDSGSPVVSNVNGELQVIGVLSGKVPDPVRVLGHESLLMENDVEDDMDREDPEYGSLGIPVPAMVTSEVRIKIEDLSLKK